MRPSQFTIHPRTAAAVALASLAILASCRSDSVLVVEPSGPVLSICHFSASKGEALSIRQSQLASHVEHGDYVTRLEVGTTAATGDSIHYRRITDALAAARAVRLARNEFESGSCRITIAVASGIVAGSTAPSSDPTFERFPLLIDVPDITLLGALRMQLDADGRATGSGVTTEATILSPTPALVVVGGGGSNTGVSEELIVVNGKTTGSKGNGAVIEGFIMRSGRAANATPVGGQGVLSMRVKDLVVRGNRFEGGFTESIDLRATSGLFERNYTYGIGGACDICLAGPGDFIARDNRVLGPGGIPGIVVVPATILPVPDIIEQYTLPAAATVSAAMTNNEVRGHLSKPAGVGLRVGAVGPGAPNVAGTSKVTMSRNNLVGNTFGIFVEAAFPVAGSALRGDVDVTIKDNTISQSCQNDLFVSFTRHASGLGLNTPYPSYLRNSTYALTLGPELPFANAWVANPAGFGNTLVVNGQALPPSSKTAYDATKVCS